MTVRSDDDYTPDGVRSTKWDSEKLETWDEVDGVEVAGSRKPFSADLLPTLFPPPPLIDPAEYPPEDERVAADALLTEDSVGYRAVIGLLIAKGVITEAEVAAAQAAALQRLTVLADRPDIRRQMMAERIARAEAARG